MINILMELFGTARISTGRRMLELAVPEQAEISDVIEALAEICPELVGKVIMDDRSRLQESYTLNLNGTSFVRDGRLCLKPGDRLLLFSSQAGG